MPPIRDYYHFPKVRISFFNRSTTARIPLFTDYYLLFTDYYLLVLPT